MGGAAVRAVPVLLTPSHPVHELRTQVRADKKPPLDEVANTPTFVALWRGEDQRVHYRGISAAEHALIESLRRGDNLGAACDHAVTRTDNPAELATQLQSWFRRDHAGRFGLGADRSELTAR